MQRKAVKTAAHRHAKRSKSLMIEEYRELIADLSAFFIRKDFKYVSVIDISSQTAIIKMYKIVRKSLKRG